MVFSAHLSAEARVPPGAIFRDENRALTAQGRAVSAMYAPNLRISGHQNVQHKARSRRHSGATSSEGNAVVGILVATRRACSQAVICGVSAF